jgi:hypothetical protein
MLSHGLLIWTCKWKDRNNLYNYRLLGTTRQRRTWFKHIVRNVWTLERQHITGVWRNAG